MPWISTTSPCSGGSPWAVTAGLHAALGTLAVASGTLLVIENQTEVLHAAAAFGAQGGDPVEQVVGGAGAVAADQQRAPARGGPGRSRSEGPDVIGGGVGAVIIVAQQGEGLLGCSRTTLPGGGTRSPP